MPDDEAGLRRLYVTAVLVGIGAFIVGLVLDQWTGYPQQVPGYTAGHMIPIQVVMGLVVTITIALATGHHRTLDAWNACLFSLGGIVSGWIAWSAYLLTG